MRKLRVPIALVLLLSLAGCGRENAAPEPAKEPVSVAAAATPTPFVSFADAPADIPEEVPASPPTTANVPATAAKAVEPGTYTWETDGALWMVMLRDTGLFTLMERTEKQDILHSGEGWSDNGDGTVTCGAAQIEGQSFCRRDGSSVWRILDDGHCEPVMP